MKTFFSLLLFTLCMGNLRSQDLYTRTQSETLGLPSFITKRTNATTITYYKKNKLKIEISTMDSKQTNLLTEQGASILNQIGPDKNCGHFTREEMNADSLEIDAVVTDVKIEKTEETKTILGYTCKKIIIRYKISQVTTYASEMRLWCTDEVKLPSGAKLPELNKRNALTVAIMNLNSFPLETETLMELNNVSTVSKVVELSTKEIDEEVFTMNPKDCKKPLNLKDYKAMLLKRQHQAQMMSR